jgi:hypothetical protein
VNTYQLALQIPSDLRVLLPVVVLLCFKLIRAVEILFWSLEAVAVVEVVTNKVVEQIVVTGRGRRETCYAKGD